MTTRLDTWNVVGRGLLGVLLSSAGMFLGFELGNATAGVLGGEPGIWARMGKGFVWGAVIAGLQWPIVRAVGVPPVRFLGASAVGFAIGYPLGQTIQLIFAHQFKLDWTGYWLAVATFGLCLGVPQWWTFRMHLKPASLWVLSSVTGWMLTGLAWISFRAGDGLDSIVYGIVTGVSLVWLVHSQSSTMKSKGS